ncbi:MAG: Gfo/Idh/MocA family oxidoreductase [Candidatus Eisenbacteria bacterium]|uniref:Gfo/Idh/MocA family oxidoreductase n=1 Tax=Eiseniibacteriota bacterium TaxID=2212470 RepID=A0A849SPS6_UNCEI|nr:Gfo/Idh/MocA family oxidoreductase [Candidatus Eisenbacteria bacterium]
MKVRAGVWGVGAWGEKHARVYHDLYGRGVDVELVGVFDERADRAAAVALAHGVRAFETPDALLAGCDAISVAVPTIAHRAATERALSAGCHVLVEKPMAVTVVEADSMIATAERAGRLLQVGQVERFNPALLAARPHVREAKFIEGHRLALFQPRSLDIDVVSDLMIHDIDAVLQFVGSAPEHVSAVGVAVLSPNEDIANARLEWANGCVANLTASRVSQERLRRIRFFTSETYVSVDLFEKTGELVRVDLETVRRLIGMARAAGIGGSGDASGVPAGPIASLPGITRSSLDVAPGEPLRLELEAFVRSIRGGGEGAASAWAGREALRVAEAVRDSMKRRAVQWSTT